jgi:hypothetical protein
MRRTLLDGGVDQATKPVTSIPPAGAHESRAQRDGGNTPPRVVRISREWSFQNEKQEPKLLFLIAALPSITQLSSASCDAQKIQAFRGQPASWRRFQAQERQQYW